MAGHLEVDKIKQQDLLSALWKFLDKTTIGNMPPFVRYKDENLTWQRLTDRNEEKDLHVLTVYPWTFKFEDGEICEGAIAEIHIGNELIVNKIYMVM